MARGKAFFQKHDYSRAVLEFKNASLAMPKDAEPYYQLGVAYEASGDLPEAVVAFRTTLLFNPKHAGAQLKVAELMAAATDPGLLKDAQSRLKVLVQSSPVTPEMLNTLALTELKLGETENAGRTLEQALAHAPKELSYSIMLARTRLLQKDPKGAEEILKKACVALPNSADPRVILGSFYRSQNQPAAAEAEYRQALAIDPTSGPALLDLALLLNSAGRAKEAEETLRRLTSVGEKPFKPFLAMFLFQTGRHEEALAEFQRLANADPADRQRRTWLVAAYRAVHKTTDAQKVLDTALKKNPKDVDALLQRGEMFLADGKYEQSQRDLYQVLHFTPDSAEVHYILAKLYKARGAALSYRQELSEALRLNPYLLGVRLELAQTFLASNGANAALDTMKATPEGQKELTAVLVQRNWAYWALGDQSAMRKGIDQGLARERTIDLLVQDGLWKLHGGDPSGARRSLEEALKYNPSDLRALAGLRQSYLAQRQAPLALQKVKEYASRQAASAPVQEFLGMILFANGDYSQARAAFSQAATLDPQFIRADLSLIQLDVAENKWADAGSKLKAVLGKDVGNITARLWLGDVEAEQGNYDLAIDDFRQVIQARPDDAEALNNFAYLLADYRKQPDEALRHAQRALELAPQDPNYADTMGWILYQKGLYSSAVAYLERAAGSDGNVTWKYHLAMAYAKLGDSRRARATLATALQRDGNTPEAKLATALIDQQK